MDTILFGILLALFAGIATALGSAIVFFIKELKNSYLAFSLAFSTGVMITVSFIELLPMGIDIIGFGKALVLFFAGTIVIFLIDYFIPHEYIMERVLKPKKGNEKEQNEKNHALLKVGWLTALGLAIHNFPEGLAVFAGNLYSITFGITIAIAIAIHNITEGIAISIPIFFATQKKRQAFIISFFSGIAEPIGAILGAIILLPILSQELIGGSLAFVAGVMVYICMDELLPTAVRYSEGNSHLMTFGFLLGSGVMSATLVMLT